jgi:hypothetical protein
MELRISFPSLPHFSSAGVTVSLASPHFYSLELFLAQEIINRNLGLMEKTFDQGEAFIKIKLPVSECLSQEIDHEENPHCR